MTLRIRQTGLDTMLSMFPGSAWIVTLCVLATSSAVFISYLLSDSSEKALRVEESANTPLNRLPSVLIPAYTSHGRHLPIPSRHAFSYPLIYLGVDIDDLQAGLLDVRYRFFKYGGSPMFKVLGLRSDKYLIPGPESLRIKVNKLLIKHGVEEADIGRVWLVTMPSYLGFEGINPLSTWFIYDKQGDLLACILEVHNTFGEKHAYVLRTTSEYREDPKPGHNYAWAFPRSFHVSPFNSRNGHYRLDLVDPFHNLNKSPTTPQIKISLRLLTTEKQLKLTAILASHPDHKAIPLTSQNQAKLLRAIIRWPLALVLSTPRILYHAWILHYEKKLAVFPRPEPRVESDYAIWNSAQVPVDNIGTALEWQPTSLFEKYARKIVRHWARKRAEICSVGLTINFSQDGTVIRFPSGQKEKMKDLVITTSHPKLFTSLLCQPTAEHFLILAPEIHTTVSDPTLFKVFFGEADDSSDKTFNRWISALQYRYFMFLCSCSNIAPPPHLIIDHPKDFATCGLSLFQKILVYQIIWWAYIADWAEELIMRSVKAEWVPGGHPQRIWERALRRQYTYASRDIGTSIDPISEGWEDIGSLLYRTQ